MSLASTFLTVFCDVSKDVDASLLHRSAVFFFCCRYYFDNYQVRLYHSQGGKHDPKRIRTRHRDALWTVEQRQRSCPAAWSQSVSADVTRKLLFFSSAKPFVLSGSETLEGLLGRKGQNQRR